MTRVLHDKTRKTLLRSNQRPGNQIPPLFARAIAAGHGQISGPPLAMLGAGGIQAADARQVVHGAAPPVRSSRLDGDCVIPRGYIERAGECNRVRPPGISIDLRKLSQPRTPLVNGSLLPYVPLDFDDTVFFAPREPPRLWAQKTFFA